MLAWCLQLVASRVMNATGCGQWKLVTVNVNSYHVALTGNKRVHVVEYQSVLRQFEQAVTIDRIIQWACGPVQM